MKFLILDNNLVMIHLFTAFTLLLQRIKFGSGIMNNRYTEDDP